MNFFEDRPNRKFGNDKKKNKKIFIDEDTIDKTKSMKSFKQKKRQIEEDDDEWKNWKETYQ
jgi:hypothetical protein